MSGQLHLSQWVVDLWKHEGAVRPESEQRPESEADDIRTDVVCEWGVELEHVMAEPQAANRDEECNPVEYEEQQVLAAHVGAAPVAEGPVAVAEVGNGGGDGDAHDLRGDWPVVEGAFAACKAEQVKGADVDDEGDESDDPELCEFADDRTELLAQRLDSA